MEGGKVRRSQNEKTEWRESVEVDKISMGQGALSDVDAPVFDRFAPCTMPVAIDLAL